VFGTVVGGILLTKFGFYSPFYIVGTSFGLIGSILLHFSTIDSSTVRICSYAALVGFGAGVYSQVGFAVAQANVDKNRVGQAIGFLTTGQLIGAVTSMAIGGTILLNDATVKLTGLLPEVPVEVIKNAIAGTAGNFLDSLDSETRRSVLKIIVGAIDKVFILGIVAGVVGLICSVLLKHERIMGRGEPDVENIKSEL
jgi:MFS family permease